MPDSNHIQTSPGTSAEDIAQMVKQYAQSNVNMFDYGKLMETDPLAYLGHLVTPSSNVGTYKTPLNALGITIVQPDKPGSMQERVTKEAGFDPASSAGKILLGPEYARDKNNFTFEHELQHRGLTAIHQLDPQNHMPITMLDQEIVLRVIHALQGDKEDKQFLDENTYLNTSKIDNLRPDIADLMNEAKKLYSKAGK